MSIKYRKQARFRWAAIIVSTMNSVWILHSIAPSKQLGGVIKLFFYFCRHFFFSKRVFIIIIDSKLNVAALIPFHVCIVFPFPKNTTFTHRQQSCFRNGFVFVISLLLLCIFLEKKNSFLALFFFCPFCLRQRVICLYILGRYSEEELNLKDGLFKWFTRFISSE